MLEKMTYLIDLLKANMIPLILGITFPAIAYTIDKIRNKSHRLNGSSFIFRHLIDLFYKLRFRINRFKIPKLYQTDDYISIFHYNDLTKLDNDLLHAKSPKEKESHYPKYDELVNKGFINNESVKKEGYFSNTKDTIKTQLLKKQVTPNGMAKKLEALFDETALDTSDFFLQPAREDYNNINYGVNTIDIATKRKKEITIGLVETDYYSFKFATKLLNKIRENKPDYIAQEYKNSFVLDSTAHKKLEQLNDYTPFMCALGVGGFVVVNRGMGDELIFVKRSENLHHGGFWHYSYDETVDLADKDRYTADPTVLACLNRALNEELGISKYDLIQYTQDSNKKIFEIGIIQEEGKRFELQILTGVRINLSRENSWEHFVYSHQKARDKEQESVSIKCVKIKDLDIFLSRCGAISPEARYLAYQMKCACKNKQI